MVRRKTYVTGGQKILDNISKAIKDIEGRTLQGLIEAAIDVIRDTELTSPTVPVELGNLRNSRFVTSSRGASLGEGAKFVNKGKGAAGRTRKMAQQHSSIMKVYAQAARQERKPLVTLGYSANYATYVHENVGAKFQRPGSGAKWLQAAVTRNRKRILETIRNHAKVGK